MRKSELTNMSKAERKPHTQNIFDYFLWSRILRNCTPQLAVAQSSFSWYRLLIQTAHISITILSQFCSQIKLKTSYNWEHLVEVSKMNADFHVRSVTGECFSWEYFIAPVIRRSNDKSYCTCSVLVVNQKLLLSKFQGKKNVIYCIGLGWSILGKTLPSVLRSQPAALVHKFKTLGKVFLYMDLPVGK